jgi:hypothetical protein
MSRGILAALQDGLLLTQTMQSAKAARGSTDGAMTALRASAN